ncbi:MAG: hypothetical protein OSA99_12325 [Acidimicrobiales bacterium]|nr:hypothetical protein [Acidimicrobiales bacterium]
MATYTRVAMLAAAGLVLTACDITISPHRVTEGGGDTITATANDVDAPLECLDGSPVSVFLVGDDGVPVLQDTTTSVGGMWTVEFPAPADAGAYSVYSDCDRGSEETQGISEELLVQEPFAPQASPASYVTGSGPASVVVDGAWCVSSSDAGSFPSVEGTLGADVQAVVALAEQPFGEVWELSFAAPDAPGTYVVDVVCDYLDIGGFPGIPLPGESTAAVPFAVHGLVASPSTSLQEGETLTVDSADSSPCVGGDVAVRVLEGATEVAAATPVVGDDGSWSVDFADLEAGDYTVEAACDRAADAETGPFDYAVLSATVAGTPTTSTTTAPTTTTTTTAPTTTTTAPAAAVPAAGAQPVAAQPQFTG